MSQDDGDNDIDVDEATFDANSVPIKYMRGKQVVDEEGYDYTPPPHMAAMGAHAKRMHKRQPYRPQGKHPHGKLLSDRKPDPFKKPKANPFKKHNSSGRKPEPNLLRDTSGDTARLSWAKDTDHSSVDKFVSKKKHKSMHHNRKPEPNLLRDTSGDTARLSWAKDDDRKSVNKIVSKRKPAPNLLRDTSGDTARLSKKCGSSKLSTDKISSKKVKKHNLIQQKPEPNLLRDTSGDTARLSWAKGAEKISPLIKHKKGSILGSTTKKTGALVSEKHSSELAKKLISKK